MPNAWPQTKRQWLQLGFYCLLIYYAAYFIVVDFDHLKNKPNAFNASARSVVFGAFFGYLLNISRHYFNMGLGIVLLQGSVNPHATAQTWIYLLALMCGRVLRETIVPSWAARQ